MTAPIIESDRLILKPLGLVHLSTDYVDWMNDYDVYKFMDSGGNYTLNILKEYLVKVEKKQIYFWAIHIKNNDIHIGNVKTDPINFKQGLAEYGIMMGRKTEWGKGYAKEATISVLNYCFEILKLRKVTLGVVADNNRAVTLYKNLGFEIEGIYKKHGFYDNKLCDCLRMALFNPKFQ